MSRRAARLTPAETNSLRAMERGARVLCGRANEVAVRADWRDVSDENALRDLNRDMEDIAATVVHLAAQLASLASVTLALAKAADVASEGDSARAEAAGGAR